MQLSELLIGSPACANMSLKNVDVTHITSDSREARPGSLFAAIPGVKQDGRDFIAQAIEKGAVAILAPPGTVLPDQNVALITDVNPRQRLALLAAAFYERQPEIIVAVTGTNGKSSTVNFCRQIWQMMDHAAASLGTIGITAPGINRSGSLTTPDPVTLHSELAELEAAGVTHLALEASSQGMDQYRLDGVKIKAAAFLNLTRDHLDYHKTMESYFAAKARLFSDLLPEGGIAVLNADTPEYAALAKICAKRGVRVLGFGRQGRDIRLKNQKPLGSGQYLELEIFGETYNLELPLVGMFQALNALAAMGLVIAQDPDNTLLHMQVVHAMERLHCVRGRLELAATLANGAAVYVDYAHTPDGLETVLTSIRPHCHGKLRVVFGCGGDRDRGKRPIMGEIAARLADDVIVTDDNPRTEDAGAIRAEVMKGCPTAAEIAGRRDAILCGVRKLGPDDVLVIAGKGHEQGQIVGKQVLPFDDVTEARNAVNEVKQTCNKKSCGQ